MITFLLQTIDGRVCHDFVFELVNSIEYQNWKDPDDPIQVQYCELYEIPMLSTDEVKDFIPVGTVEFVFSFIDNHVKKDGSQEIQPLNVPSKLKYWGERLINNYILDSDRMRYSAVEHWVEDSGMNMDSKVFIKSNEKIKSDINGFHNLTDITSREIIPDGKYQISGPVEILSEYRVFVYQDMIMGIQYYNGDFMVMPDTSTIKHMVELYDWDYGHGPAPVAYTLDVAVVKTDQRYATVVIECHEFFSCGLYGFTSPRLPFMFSRMWNDIKKKLLK